MRWFRESPPNVEFEFLQTNFGPSLTIKTWATSAQGSLTVQRTSIRFDAKDTIEVIDKLYEELHKDDMT